MRTTDPLREALERIAAVLADARWPEETDAAAIDRITRDALAEWASRPDDCSACGEDGKRAVFWTEDGESMCLGCLVEDREEAWRRALAAVPAEPEAWEWAAAVKLRPASHHPAFYAVASLRAAKAEAERRAAMGRKTWVARRRPGTAPGPWERVDPEPREEGA